ncbi:MAG: HEAT repeat domain-containing protein [Candidatus Brocadiia bacterium]
MNRCLWTALPLALLALAPCAPAGEATVDDLVAELRGRREAPDRSPAELQAVHARVLDALLPRFASTDVATSGESRKAYERICSLAGRSGAARTAACEAILARLRPDLPRPALLTLLEGLELLGREDAVEPLAGLLAHADALVRERARRALQANSSPAASKALRQALDRARSPEWRLALANALGAREDAEALDALIGLAGSDHEALRLAAVDALAAVGHERAVNPIARATQKASAHAWNATVVAYLALADRLAADGQKALALSMYKKLLGAHGHVKCAALIGLGRAGGAEELPTLLEALASPQAPVRGAAMAGLRLMPPVVFSQAMGEKAKAADPEMKTLLLKVLAERGEKALVPTAIAAAKDPNERVRVAAYQCLGALGDARAVPALLEALARAQGAELEAARAALGRIPGQGVNDAVLDAMEGAPPAVQARLIRVLADRRAADAVPALLRAARQGESPAREEAVEALGRFAGQPALAPLVEMLVAAKDEARRKTIEKALSAVCARVADLARRNQPLLDALPKAPVAARRAILRILGRNGGEKALQAVRDAVRAAEPPVRDAAVRALARWPDPVVADELLELARSAEELAHRVIAFDGALRALAGLDRMAPARRLERYAAAMDAAPRPQDRKKVLAGLAEVHQPEALEMALRHLADEALRGEAAAAAVGIATAISGSHRKEAKAALGRVLDATEDQALRQKAQEAIAHIEKFEDYITAWEVAGPYTVQGKKGQQLHDVAFPPEQDPAEADWKPMPAGLDPEMPWLMDLGKALGGEERAAYLRTHVWSPRDQKARLEFGSDDGAKVWLGGELVLSVNEPRSHEAGENKVEVTLQKGWNPLLVKVWQGAVDWSASARFRAPDGSHLEGLRAAAPPQ